MTSSQAFGKRSISVFFFRFWPEQTDQKFQRLPVRPFAVTVHSGTTLFCGHQKMNLNRGWKASTIKQPEESP